MLKLSLIDCADLKKCGGNLEEKQVVNNAAYQELFLLGWETGKRERTECAASTNTQVFRGTSLSCHHKTHHKADGYQSTHCIVINKHAQRESDVASPCGGTLGGAERGQPCEEQSIYKNKPLHGGG